ncbi:MAG: hypothetical protein FK730_10510 [Asgard group archaeon]|nr:hypothetical protein [Asgard group archaeon]
MSKKQKEILDAVKDKVEIIESERYNSKDPIVKILSDDSKEEVIIKLLTAERTGAPLKFEKDFINPTEDIAKRAFRNGVRILNSWLFKRSSDYLDEAAKNTNDLLLQQRVTLYKQLNNLLQNVIGSQPDKVMKRTSNLFDDTISSIKKYDQFSKSEMEFYLKAVDSLFNITTQLQDDNSEIRTQRLLCKASISLTNKEYLAAYIWLFKIYLLNKEIFDNIASNDEILESALKNLQIYIKHETGLSEYLDDLPTMASAYDLNTIFIDHLSTIYDDEFLAKTKQNFSFPIFRENS